MNKPHKHCEVIKAWADGKPIQYYNVFSSNWLDASNPISWDEGNRYRVKPEPNTRWTRLYRNKITNIVYPILTHRKWHCKDAKSFLGPHCVWVSDWIEIVLNSED